MPKHEQKAVCQM